MASHRRLAVNDPRCGAGRYGRRVAWTWRYETSAGKPVAGVPGETFPTQADAETWIGEHWRDLLDDGVDQVVLVENDRDVYGPMSLHSP